MSFRCPKCDKSYNSKQHQQRCEVKLITEEEKAWADDLLKQERGELLTYWAGLRVGSSEWFNLSELTRRGFYQLVFHFSHIARHHPETKLKIERLFEHFQKITGGIDNSIEDFWRWWVFGEDLMDFNADVDN